jgi:hypothetical protein
MHARGARPREFNKTVSAGQVDYRLLHFWLCIEHGQCDENTGAAPASLRSGSTRLREHFGGSNLAVYRIGKPSKVILQCPQCNVL